MSNGFIPKSEGDKLIWLQNFAAKLTIYGPTLSIAPPEVTDMTDKTNQSGADVMNAESAMGIAHAAVQTKRLTLLDAVTYARSIVARIQPHPAMTDAIRAEMFITIRDTSATPTDPDAIMTIPPPLIRLDWSVRRQTTIHWGPNPDDERRNSRPVGTVGAMIQWARGGIPANDASWSSIEIDTDSPFIHHVEENVPIPLAYRARYVSVLMKFGPPSDPAICTITP